MKQNTAKNGFMRRIHQIPKLTRFLFVLTLFNILFVVWLFIHQFEQQHIQAVRIAQAQVYLAKNPIFPSLDALSHFVKTHFGENSNRASQFIYRIHVYGKTECVQAIWHTGFFVVNHYAYQLFSCSGKNNPKKID